MRFAVIGGAGFIGSYLTKQLLKNGHYVLVIDNLHTGKKENLKNLENMEFYNIDIRNYLELQKVLKNIDGIFHEAALTNVQESFEKPEEYYDVNVNGTENIFKIANNCDIKVVFASSASIYGNVDKMLITEDTPSNPINPYGKTKVECEKLAKKYSKRGLPVIGLRYFNVFGIGQTLTYAGVITKFLTKLENKMPPIIFGDGKQIRDFIYVDDVIEANIQAMLSNTNLGFFNIGTGKSTSILELANIMIKLSGNNFNPIFKKSLQGDIRKSIADIVKINEFLGWKSKISLEEGLKKIIQN
jgi:UDP-glucose 4-epimerase